MRHELSHNGYPHIEPLKISDEELREQIAREAQTRLHMTYDEFLKAYYEGDLPDTPAVNELVILLDFVEYSSHV
jgi:hypothetical protein